MTSIALLMLLFTCLALVLLSGFPVAFVLAGVSVLFALLGDAMGIMDMPAFFSALPNRLFGTMRNDLLLAVPLFIFMGVMLEKSKLAEELLETMSALMGRVKGGLGLSVMVVGTLLAASTGIVGATVVTMGLISLPAMLRNRYRPDLATGSICAAGTLGQIIPPSIVLLLLGDQISSAFQNAQMQRQVLVPAPLSVADIFMGALLPGLGLVLLYCLYLVLYAYWRPEAMPAMSDDERARVLRHGLASACRAVLQPLLLVLLVLGSILAGFATATEAAGVGAAGAMLLAGMRGQLNRDQLEAVMRETTRMTCMIFTILIGAAFFSLVFRALEGEDMVQQWLSNLPGGLPAAMTLVMLVVFFLGFFLDFIEITYVVVPLVAPGLLLLGADPVWLAVMFAVNLQTSFLTPPFGFSLFYLRGVAPKVIRTGSIYRGVVPFIGLQLAMLGAVACLPALATALPNWLYGSDFSRTFAQENLAGSDGIDNPYEQYIDF